MPSLRSLGSDNHAGVHPKILEAIQRVNENHSPAYGTDDLTAEVQQIFKNEFGDRAETYFVFNGTAANVISIAAFTKSFNSVICARESHLNMDECGAPEAIAGIKLRALDCKNAKLTIDICEKELKRLGDQHYSQPKMLSLTLPTEYGELYSLNELKDFSTFCKANKLYLHIDGARLIHAATQLNLNFKEFTQDIGVDIVSFGGTKNGLLFGEAIVCFDSEVSKSLKFYRKQMLQLPSKMRFLSAQFKELFTHDLWREISSHECAMAKYLEEKLKAIPELEIVNQVQANSVFVKIPKAWTKDLKNHHFFYVWDDEIWVVRWMMSYDTSKEELDSFVNEIERLKNGALQ